MSNQPKHIYLVMDGDCPMAAFTVKRELITFLKRRLDTFIKPLLYTFGAEQGYMPSVLRMSRALAE
jgi:hypothetical protein